MRLLVVAPRYGIEVAGGAERLARDVAEGLAARGHEVRVVTTCARRYDSWANELPAGESLEAGVVVERHPTAIERPVDTFLRLSARVLGSSAPARPIQEEWLRLQGPWAPGIETAIAQHGAWADALVVVPYLYWPALAALRARPERLPALLVPAAHDEPTLRIPLMREVFESADAIAYLTLEEEALAKRWFPRRAPGAVLGAGVAPISVPPAHVDAFRAKHGLGDRPYLAVVGRLEPAKGSAEVVAQFVAYRGRNPETPLRLVVVGEPVHPVEAHPDVVVTGFVRDAEKDAAIAGAFALVQPSYFESFSLVLCEAWRLGVPGLVNAHCEVLAGQARRSGGAIPYRGFAQFEAGVDLLVERPDLRTTLGARGGAYVDAQYDPDVVVGRYERVLRALAG